MGRANDAMRNIVRVYMVTEEDDTVRWNTLRSEQETDGDRVEQELECWMKASFRCLLDGVRTWEPVVHLSKVLCQR
jgi:hypothetical protein